MLNSIFESHAHYDDSAFDEDRDALFISLQKQHITPIINVGASIASTQKTIELMNRYPFIYGALGIHPSETGELTEADMIWLRSQCESDKAVAIGEIGLDYHYQKPTREIQKHWFIRQLDLAKEMGLPVIIHSREAAKDTLDIMKTERADKLTGVIHCFSYSMEIAREYLNMGYYFGIGGVLTYPDAKKLKEVAAYLPLDSILLETDCPYLAPQAKRGQRNDSSNLLYVAEELARIKKTEIETIIAKTRENACRLFSIEEQA